MKVYNGKNQPATGILRMNVKTYHPIQSSKQRFKMLKRVILQPCILFTFIELIDWYKNNGNVVFNSTRKLTSSASVTIDI